MKIYKLLGTASILILTPVAVFAADFNGIKDLLEAFGRLVQTMTLVVAALALLAFMFGLMKFIFRAGDPGKKAEGKSIMIWGLIALFVMVSIWGIIAFFQRDLNITPSDIGSPGANCGGIYRIPC